MGSRRWTYLLSLTVGGLALLQPWFFVNRGGAVQAYYGWGIFSGESLYIFTPLDLFDLPLFIAFSSCVLGVILQVLGGISFKRRLASRATLRMAGIALALSGALGWALALNEYISPEALSGPGYHFEYTVTSWGIGLYLMLASGILGIFSFAKLSLKLQ